MVFAVCSLRRFTAPKMEYKIYASPSNFLPQTPSPSPVCLKSRKRAISTGSTFFQYPSIRSNLQKPWIQQKKFSQKIKRILGVPLDFFKIFGRNFFVDFFTFNGWALLRGTKNGVFRRQLINSSIYRSNNGIQFTFPSNLPSPNSFTFPVRLKPTNQAEVIGSERFQCPSIRSNCLEADLAALR